MKQYVAGCNNRTVKIHYCGLLSFPTDSNYVSLTHQVTKQTCLKYMLPVISKQLVLLLGLVGLYLFSIRLECISINTV